MGRVCGGRNPEEDLEERVVLSIPQVTTTLLDKLSTESAPASHEVPDYRVSGSEA